MRINGEEVEIIQDWCDGCDSPSRETKDVVAIASDEPGTTYLCKACVGRILEMFE